MIEEPEGAGAAPDATEPMPPWPPPTPDANADATPTLPQLGPERFDQTIVAPAVRPSLESRAEAGWQAIRRAVLVAIVSVVLGFAALLVLGAVVAPFDGDRSFTSAALHIAARLWFVGVVYSAAAVPVARVGLRAGRDANGAVRRLVVGRRYGRWLVTIGFGTPVVGFALLEPTAALIVLAVLVAAVVVLALLGVSF